MIVRCRGCKRAIGVAVDSHYSIYCSERCAEDFPAGDYEERDAIILAMNASGWLHKDIAQRFGVSRQRVVQICQERRLAS